jgi:putative ABC transport system substrate-binding protein
MQDIGYSLHRNLILDIRYARGDTSRLPALAEELLALKPDVVLGIQPAALAFAQKTRTIPIVMAGSSDPVAAGLVQSLARPGTNVTGMAHLYIDVVPKQTELLAEIVPRMSRVGLLNDPSSVERERFEQALRRAAQARKLALSVASAQDTEGVRRAFEQFRVERVQGLIVGSSGTMVFLRHEIMKQAAASRLPAIYAQSDIPREGGLMSYGADLPRSYRHDVPRFVDRILKGEKPSEMAVQQTTKYVLVINMRAAQSIGIVVPQAVLARADEVIQ